jgi:capsular polysaccharide export protein
LNIFIGFYPWKSLFWRLFDNTTFITSKKNHYKFIKIFEQTKRANIYIWGHKISKNYEKIFNKYKIKPIRVEDGFIRSFGLGLDFIKPKSVVMDKSGIYYDSFKTSDLEKILSTLRLTKELQFKTRHIINNIIKNNITKYNVENIKLFEPFQTNKKKIIFVVGQVAKDASIQYGTFVYKTDLDLIRKVRSNNKEAFILYKPHPDVLSGNRAGADLNIIEKYADKVALDLSIFNCLKICNEVHTLTSLVGFDALIRGKKVFTYGAPFYAGWGLTVDMDKSSPAFKRRKRKLTLEELVYGCLIKYPIYWDYEKNKKTTCVHVIKQIIKERDAYWRVNTKSPIEKPYLYRQFKRAVILAKSYFLLFIIFFLFLTNHSQADSISLFGGKSVDSNLIDFPKKAISNDLEIEQHKIIGIAYQQKIQTPVILGKANSHIEYIFANHSPKDLIETVIAYNIQTPSFAISSVHMRLGFSLGLSYVHGTPIFEDGTKEEPGKKYQLLNYNAYEVSLLDTEDKDSVFLRLHHRSGVYGLIAPQHVGSNFITFGLRKYF